MTHTELCILGAKYMKAKGILKWHKPKYVVIEIELAGGAQPDIYGFGTSSYTQQIEVKVSRSDFLSDKRKFHRIYPERDAGQVRSYLCPEGMIKPEELPDKWGLLYVDSENKIRNIVDPIVQETFTKKDIDIICSVMRRIDIKSQIFSFKNYKS